jgi:hypothetical protein
MYSTVLLVHSWVRWIALVAGIGATAAALGRHSSSGGWGRVLTISLDLQMLLGLLLYFVVSPNMAAIREHFGEAMQTPSLRFWAVEHVTMMIVALALAHMGRALAAKAATPEARRNRSIVFFGLSTLAMLAGTPWPGLPYGRPLFRVS